MRGIAIRGSAPVPAELPRPRIESEHDVLVRVELSAWNGLDAVRMRTAPGVAPGIEFSGRVAEHGDGVGDLPPGTPVIGLVGAGALAEYVLVPRATLLRRPDWMAPETAGGFTEMFTIAFDAIEQLAVTEGETAVVRGANGGIGNGIVQLLRTRGVRSIGIVRARRPELPQADETLVGAEPAPGAEALFECVGPGFLGRDVEAVGEEGRILLLGALGELSAGLDFLQFMQKRVRLIGTTFSSRPARAKASLLAAVEREVLPLLERGVLRVPVDSSFEAADCAASFARFSSGEAVGKVLIRF